MNSKKDTAEAEKILSFLGKPTTTTSYSVKTNPAIIKLMKYLNGDIAQVCRWTDTLKKLGWVEPDMTEREMEKQLTKYASFVDKKVSQMSREEMLTPPQVAKRGRPRKDAEEKPKKSKKVTKERIDPELVESAVDTQDIGMVAMMQKEITHLRKKYTDSQIMEYEHRRLVKELSAELEAAKPDKFELKASSTTSFRFPIFIGAKWSSRKKSTMLMRTIPTFPAGATSISSRRTTNTLPSSAATSSTYLCSGICSPATFTKSSANLTRWALPSVSCSTTSSSRGSLSRTLSFTRKSTLTALSVTMPVLR